MSLRARIEAARDGGVLAAEQAAALVALERGEPLSLHGEIRALLYLGVLLVAAGVAMTVQTYSLKIGPALLIAALSIGALGSFAHVFRRAPAWSRGLVPAPTPSFDYALLLGCLLFSIDVGYIEARFGLLGASWRWHLLAGGALFLSFAYRFDNRLVLSLGLSSLAGWLGLEMFSLGGNFWDFHGMYTLGFGALCVAAGFLSLREGLKAHFLDTYLNVAAPFLGFGLLSGVEQHRLGSFHFYLLTLLCSATAVYAFRTRKLAYLVWASLCGYIGLSIVLLWAMRDVVGTLLYFIVSAVAFMAGLFWAARTFKEDR